MPENKYKLTVGLEIHAELKTQTKMFCDSRNDPEEPSPNSNICPICVGHPGTLPVINKEAVRHVLKVGLAVGGKIADFTEFDRKNYFYPDIPKGYQISQYKYPLISGGELCGVKLTRIHLEEDTGSSLHEEGDYSLIDFNRAGTPLMELVTEPVIHDAKEAGDFARELQLTLRYLGAGEANMEKGQMRVEANISVSATEKFGTKVEVKNLNSFRSVERAIAYEYGRQVSLLKEGGKVVQETRGWDESKQKTFSQRVKEDSHDYRYFPDPDLPKLWISEIPEFDEKVLKKGMPELPHDKRVRYQNEYGIKNEDIEIFIGDFALQELFEKWTISKLEKDKNLFKLASNYITNDLVKIAAGDPQKIDRVREHFAGLILMIGKGEISSRGAKDILAEMGEKGNDPKKIAEEKNLFQKSNENELKGVVEEIVKNNPKVVSDYRAGKEASLQYLVGQGMKATRGSANPELLKKLIMEKVGK